MSFVNPTFYPRQRALVTPRVVNTSYTFTTSNLPPPYKYFLSYVAINYFTGGLGGNRALLIEIRDPTFVAFPVLGITYPVGGIVAGGTLYQVALPAGIYLSGGLTGGFNPGVLEIKPNFTFTIFDLAGIDAADLYLSAVYCEKR